jgi:hypothetical protein
MNKQQKTYFLLFTVLIIWGIIGYQIYIRLNPPITKLEKIELKNTFVPQQNIENTLYELSTTYRDPFLGEFPKKKNRNRKRIVKPKTTVPFPSVVYNGVIGGGKSKSYILTINGRQDIVKLGKTFQDVKLLSANTKQIIVRFQGVKKIIQLQ